MILLDLDSPGMTADEFLSIIKSYYRMAAIPVLTFSRHDMPRKRPTLTTPDRHFIRPAPAQILEGVQAILGVPEHGPYRD